jgi:hypothetical protein
MRPVSYRFFSAIATIQLAAWHWTQRAREVAGILGATVRALVTLCAWSLDDLAGAAR